MANSPVMELMQIDNSISLQAEAISQLVPKLAFEYITEFDLGMEIPELPSTIFHKKGIYFFELKNSDANLPIIDWLDSFTRLWKEGKVTWVPGVKKRRTLAHQSLSEWVPLYLGKSKDVGGRIYEHIHQVEGKTTFSMKLKARVNLHKKRFRVSWIPLDVANYDMIAPAIESRLRDLKNPLVGKQ